MKKSKPADGFLTALADKLKHGLILFTVKKNRYLDLGDWHENKVISVEQDDPRSTAGVLVHELAEALLCSYADITAEQVDQDDFEFLARKRHHAQRCYWKQHLVALKIERLFIEALGLSWKEHEFNCRKAFTKQEKMHEKVTL